MRRAGGCDRVPPFTRDARERLRVNGAESQQAMKIAAIPCRLTLNSSADASRCSRPLQEVDGA